MYFIETFYSESRYKKRFLTIDLVVGKIGFLNC